MTHLRTEHTSYDQRRVRSQIDSQSLKVKNHLISLREGDVQHAVKALETLVSVSVEILGAKFISIGVDGNNVFQGSRINVTIQMKETMVPFFMGVHCFTHRTNLVVFIFQNLV